MMKSILTPIEDIGVTIISVNWKAGDITCDFLSSLFKLFEPSWYAVICENGSPDSSAAILRGFLKLRFSEVARVTSNQNAIIYDYFEVESKALRVSLVLSTKNLGFAGGNNLALRSMHPKVNPEYYWFLNNDTEVEVNCLTELRAKMLGDTSIGICGTTLLYAHQRDRVQALGGARYLQLTGRLYEIAQGESWPNNLSETAAESQMDYVAGASMFVSADFLRIVGPMSEDYFLYFEELDWAQRARAAGFKLGYAKKAIV